MRNQSDSVALRNEFLLNRIKAIKGEHPSNPRLIAKTVSERPKPRPDKPKHWWGKL